MKKSLMLLYPNSPLTFFFKAVVNIGEHF